MDISSGNTLKGTIVNWICLSFEIDSYEITSTVPSGGKIRDQENILRSEKYKNILNQQSASLRYTNLRFFISLFLRGTFRLQLT